MSTDVILAEHDRKTEKCYIIMNYGLICVYNLTCRIFYIVSSSGYTLCRIRDFTKHISGSLQRLQKSELLADLVASDIRAKRMVKDVSTWNFTFAMLKRNFCASQIHCSYIDSDVEL